MQIQQALQTPFGISTFGSSIVRVDPDIASLKFTVSRLEQHPKKAFRQAHEGAKTVRTYLAEAKMDDVSFSRITLTQSFKYSGGEQKFTGYIAKISFHLLLRDLDRIEEILIGIIDAGANEINDTNYQTSRLKAIRAQARQQAIAAAREKAEVYCEAAGVALGKVIHIEDVNPEQLRGGEGHVVREVPLDDDALLRAFDPSSITVGGAVLIAFELNGI